MSVQDLVGWMALAGGAVWCAGCVWFCVWTGRGEDRAVDARVESDAQTLRRVLREIRRNQDGGTSLGLLLTRHHRAHWRA